MGGQGGNANGTYGAPSNYDPMANDGMTLDGGDGILLGIGGAGGTVD